MTAPKSNTAKEIIATQKNFGTPVVVIGTTGIPRKKVIQVISADESIDRLLEQRKRNLADRSRAAQLDLAIEEDQKAATQIRLERQRMESEGRPPEESENMNGEQKIADAAETAAAAVEAGADPEQAKALATGKAKVVVIGGQRGVEPGSGGWLVVNGQPFRDPEGPYTFSQAIQVAALNTKPAETANTEIKQLVDELRNQSRLSQEQNMKVLTDSVKSLTDEVKALKTNGIANPAAHNPAPAMRARIFVQDPNDPTKINERVLEAGDVHFIPATVKPAQTGESLEEKRLNLQHTERMAEINQRRTADEESRAASKETKAMIGKVLEQAGTVAGTIIAEAKGKKAPTPEKPDNLVLLKCNCGFAVPVPSDNPEGTCPKCGNLVFPCPKCGTPISTPEGTPEVICPNPNCKNKLFNQGPTPGPASAPKPAAGRPATEPAAIPTPSQPLVNVSDSGEGEETA